MTGRRSRPAACPVDPAGLPDCGSGPRERLAFVAREFADLWRELRDGSAARAQEES